MSTLAFFEQAVADVGLALKLPLRWFTSRPGTRRYPGVYSRVESLES